MNRKVSPLEEKIKELEKEIDLQREIIRKNISFPTSEVECSKGVEQETEKIIDEKRKENYKKLENASYILTLLGKEGNICVRRRK